MAEKKLRSGRVDRRCPHTMKATDGLGVTYCCDCGKMMNVPKPEAGRLATKDA
ncbi:hypothetical protein ACQKQD_18220 [Methylobacterium sp. NPDC080182]|uniref:hypothetical protein n=1 Tax=Methylobacterium sp. NPDC080182 TaxID=3390590 RepID=UPI003CFF7A3F